MSILDRDDLLSPDEAARKLRGRVCRQTIWRWCSKGLLTRDSRRIRLPYIRLGRQVLIDPTDLEQFIQQVTDADRRERSAPSTHNPSQRRLHHRNHSEIAEREADSLGI
jgi:hypothetical protein